MATRRRPLSKSTASENTAVVYIRVSTDKQVESGLGLGDQRERLEAYCKLRGLEVVEYVTDDGVSAHKPLADRPGGARVVELVRSRKVSAVVVLKLDRAFRNTVDALLTVEQWDKRGIAFHIADMGGTAVDTSSAMGKAFLTFMVGMAECERNQAAERTTAALAYKARSGDMRMGGGPPYGWAYDGDTLVEVPHEQAIISHVRVWRAEGVTFRGVIEKLKLMGLHNRAGTDFKLSQIERMLMGSIRQMHHSAANDR